MKYLILYSENEGEVSHEMEEITKIYFDFAKNIYSEADLRKNNLKPLEILTVIEFRDGQTKTYSTLKWEMYFD